MSEFRIRQPQFADGMWYGATAAKLEAEVQGFLADAPANTEMGKIVGLVVPHAGYRFSGHVAGAGFAQLTRTYNNVVLLGPDHRGAAFGQIATPDVDAWRTPLGDVPVNRDFLQTLQDELPLHFLGTDQEHSLEIELPFLQMTLNNFSLIPLLMGSQTPSICRQLAQAMTEIIQSNRFDSVLLVASSDLSHFFDDETARQLDRETLQLILDMDGDSLADHAEAGRNQNRPLACGAGPIATVIHTTQALGATQATLIKYATSADAHPDRSRVVGYAAVAFSK